MRVFRSLKDMHGAVKNPVVTVGSYDGIHKGHRYILEILKEESRRIGGESVVLTFDPHPRSVVSIDGGIPMLLNTIEEKEYLLEEAGIDNLFIVEFTESFSKLSSFEFLKQYLLDGIGTKVLIMGYNHQFGHNRQGDKDYLESLRLEYDFQVVQIPRYGIDDTKISSTTIRTLIEGGHMKETAKYLGEPYIIIGGFDGNSSINIENPDKLVPPDGMYDVEISLLRTSETISSTVKVYNRKIILNSSDICRINFGERVVVRFLFRKD